MYKMQFSCIIRTFIAILDVHKLQSSSSLGKLNRWMLWSLPCFRQQKNTILENAEAYNVTKYATFTDCRKNDYRYHMSDKTEHWIQNTKNNKKDSNNITHQKMSTMDIRSYIYTVIYRQTHRTVEMSCLQLTLKRL